MILASVWQAHSDEVTGKPGKGTDKRAEKMSWPELMQRRYDEYQAKFVKLGL